MEPQSNYRASQDNFDTKTTLVWGGGTLAIILLAFFVLNYFNVLSLSEIFPKALGWLPHQQSASQVKVPAPAKPAATTAGNDKFTPSLNAETQKGPLVKSALVLYTLQGKVIKVTPEGDKYVIEINSLNGAQGYTLPAVGGQGILKSAKGPDASWSGIKPGDDVIVDLSVTSAGQVTVNQITITNK